MEKASRENVLALRQGIQQLLHRRVLKAIEAVLEEALSVALGSMRYERNESHRGYRNGVERREITTSEGLASSPCREGEWRRPLVRRRSLAASCCRVTPVERAKSMKRS